MASSAFHRATIGTTTFFATTPIVNTVARRKNEVMVLNFNEHATSSTSHPARSHLAIKNEDRYCPWLQEVSQRGTVLPKPFFRYGALSLNS